MAADIKNGDYNIDVTLTGGSGKATVKSPAKLHVDGDNMTAEIEWSSPNYDYMELDGEAYQPVNVSGNSLFLVDIPSLDEDIPVKAETTAMSEPHMIDYTLYFDSASVQKTKLIHSAKIEIIGVSVLIVLLLTAIGAKVWMKHEKK